MDCDDNSDEGLALCCKCVMCGAILVMSTCFNAGLENGKVTCTLDALIIIIYLEGEGQI